MEYWMIAHLIGDYILQNDWMAKNKKINDRACFYHAALYIVPFLPLLFYGIQWWQLAIICAQHYFQDRSGFVLWLMKKTGSEEFTKPPMGPWSIVVVDNIIHICFMWAVFNLPA